MTLKEGSLFSADYTRAALDAAGIKGVAVNDDASVRITDQRAAIGSLGGAVLELHVLKTVVLPTNANELRKVANSLRTALNMRNRDVFDALENDLELLDGIIANLTFDGPKGTTP